MLMMKNFGAIFVSLTARVALTVADTATWPAVSSAEAATEEKRILKRKERTSRRKGALFLATFEKRLLAAGVLGKGRDAGGREKHKDSRLKSNSNRHI